MKRFATTAIAWLVFRENVDRPLLVVPLRSWLAQSYSPGKLARHRPGGARFCGPHKTA